MSFAIKICTELPEKLNVYEFKFLKKTLDFYKKAKELSKEKVEYTSFCFRCCKDYLNLDIKFITEINFSDYSIEKIVV